MVAWGMSEPAHKQPLWELWCFSAYLLAQFLLKLLIFAAYGSTPPWRMCVGPHTAPVNISPPPTTRIEAASSQATTEGTNITISSHKQQTVALLLNYVFFALTKFQLISAMKRFQNILKSHFMVYWRDMNFDQWMKTVLFCAYDIKWIKRSSLFKFKVLTVSISYFSHCIWKASWDLRRRPWSRTSLRRGHENKLCSHDNGGSHVMWFQ